MPGAFAVRPKADFVRVKANDVGEKIGAGHRKAEKAFASLCKKPQAAFSGSHYYPRAFTSTTKIRVKAPISSPRPLTLPTLEEASFLV